MYRPYQHEAKKWVCAIGKVDRDNVCFSNSVRLQGGVDHAITVELEHALRATDHGFCTHSTQPLGLTRPAASTETLCVQGV